MRNISLSLPIIILVLILAMLFSTNQEYVKENESLKEAIRTMADDLVRCERSSDIMKKYINKRQDINGDI